MNSKLYGLPVSKLAILALTGGLLMAICQWLIYQYAPIERTMGYAQKIFYIHLPVAWWCFVGFFVSCLASISYLLTKNTKWDDLANASVQLGLFSATMALVTGMIWGRTSWGVWWTWEPRLTTTFILWLIYCAYMVIRQLNMPAQRKQTIAAVIAIVGFVDVPLVFLSTRLMRSNFYNHPIVFTTDDSGGMTPEMALTVIACVVCFGLIFAALLGLRYGQIKAKRILDKIVYTKISNEMNKEE